MSRQPSPGLAASTQQTSYYRDAHGNPIEKSGPQLKIVYRAGENQGAQLQQGASTPVPVATSSSSGRTRSKAYQSGPAAGAEDVKYAAKYRDLKHKVKEIEADNDRLMFKVLQAKRNIQRAKLERAVLYERLAQLPASPPQGNVPLPPQHVAQQQVPAGGSVPRHQDTQPYGQSGRHQRTSGSTAAHHHHRHHQQPIQPAPPSHVSPPQHHIQAHHAHHPPRDAAHPGQLPITHAQQVVTISTPDGPLRVVAGPDGRPVTTEDGRIIPAQDLHQPPPPSAPAPRKRGGRVSKEVRELREREAREMREREEMERKQAMLASAGPNSGHPPPGIEPQRSSSSHMQAVSPPLSAQAPGHVVPISSRERDWEIERENRERERMQRREGGEEERERHGHHGYHHHHIHAHGHGHRHHQERISSPPPPAEQISPPQVHRSHSQASHASYRSHHSHHSHHIHSHSHSASPLSPGGSSYPATRIHNHQRIGPGSYVLRDRERADVPPTESAAAATPIPATPMQSDDTSTSAPTPAAPPSRVPSPPYLRPGRTDIYNNNNSSPPGEEAAATAKTEARPSDEGSGTNTGSTTPT
ncbi:hypothetical protein ACEPAH_5446 [Sanghuangporus vaninii]